MCACGGAGGACAECDKKRKVLQRSATSSAEIGAVPPVAARLRFPAATMLSPARAGGMPRMWRSSGDLCMGQSCQILVLRVTLATSLAPNAGGGWRQKSPPATRGM
jgi:hypothetical protein